MAVSVHAHARAGEDQQGCMGAGARGCVQVGSGANVAQSNRGGTSHNFRLPHLGACARPCVREVAIYKTGKML